MFATKELIQIAMRIEENGEKFYKEAAEKMNDQTAQLLFYHLADEEAVHWQVFAGFLDDVDTFDPLESYPGEHRAYIQAYADHLIFNNDSDESGLNALEDAKKAIQYAIQKETESILYYQEIKKYFPKAKYSILAKIIEEERKHFTRLSKLCKGYS